MTMGFSPENARLVSSLIGFLLIITTFHKYCLCNGINNNNNVICLETEKQALLKFKHDIKDPSSRLSTWSVDQEEDCCRWSGVVCNNLTGRVHKIRLRNPYADYEADARDYRAYLRKHKLGGTINPSLVELKHLRHLDLSCNDFEGIHIPRFIGSIVSLRYLNLSQAGFSGTIPPELGNLSMLQSLDLQGVLNYGGDPKEPLGGDDLQWLSGLGSLRNLDLCNVNLGEASDWLQVINRLPSLIELHLSGCKLDYISPSIDVNFTSLAILDLSLNDFYSPIPKWIFNLNRLVSLDMSGCNFYGPIPSGLRNTSSLKFLYASNNNLSSSLFEELSSLSHGLVSLRLGYNDFHGPIPIGLQNMTSLRDLQMPGNSFNSSLPNWLYDFRQLESLNLQDNYLQGAISSAIENLVSLVSLDLSLNKLDGELPRSLGKLCLLKKITLSGNEFRGQVSEVLRSFFQCKSIGLETMELEWNSLSGELPIELGQFKSLSYLSLQDNSITGSIPLSIGRLSSLTNLDLSDNKLNGTLPESLGQLAKLESLDVSQNLLTGVVSDVHFASLTRLRTLHAQGNKITLKASDFWAPPFQLEELSLSSWQLGLRFPPWLESQGKLHALDLANTGISDSIPTWFWNKSFQLEELNLSSNQFPGEIPRHIVLAPYSIIDLSSNSFTGMLPLIPSLANVVDLSRNSLSGSIDHALCGPVERPQNALSILNLGHNQLSGTVPDCWKHWLVLQRLQLENNHFTGTIPVSIGHLSFLQSLHLRHNDLSGELPLSLQNCTSLVIIDMGENELVGSIPTWMGNSFSELRVLNLRSNKFVGNIPKELCRTNSLQILDLAHNNFSGPVPRCFNNFSAMAEQNYSDAEMSTFPTYYGQFVENLFVVTKGREVEYSTILKLVTGIDLSENGLSGDLPKELTRLMGLQSLNLSGNRLTGRIPENIGDMGQLESLDFSLNKLWGEIPSSMASLTFLSHLNLSCNNLTGKIPSGTQLRGFNESSFVGNHLCGPPLGSCELGSGKPGIGHGDEEEEEEEEEGFPKVWFFGSLAFGFVFGFWIVLGTLLFKISWRIAYFQWLDVIGHKISNFVFELRFMFSK